MKLIICLIFVMLISSMFYASNGAWQTETVDDGIEVGKYTSVAVDSNGGIHVSYYDEFHEDLKYAYYNGSQWEIEFVDAAGSVGLYSSIDIDSENRPAISYRDEGNTTLKYAYKDNGNWDTETVDWNENVGTHTSLKLDAQDRPYIAYFFQTNVMYLAYWTGSSWTIEEVRFPAYFNSLELTSSGEPCVSNYYPCAAGIGRLYYHYKDASGWQAEQVNTTGCKGAYCSLELDTNDNPYIAGYDCDAGGLFLHSKGTGSWDDFQVDSGLYVGMHCDLLLDEQNNPHISYHDGNYGDLKYAVWNGVQWNLSVVDDNGFTGTYTSICQTPDGTIHIMYYDEDNKNLKHAWNSEGPAPTPTPTPGADFVFDLGDDMTYSSGDYMEGILWITNPGPARTVDAYVLLEVLGEVWFAPTWAQTPDFYRESLSAGEERTIEYLPGFNLPGDIGPFGPFYFYAAGFTEATLSAETMISNVAVKEIMFQ